MLLNTCAFLAQPPAALATALEGDRRSIERLREAVARHPDDPDLRWALVQAQAPQDPEAAIDSLRAFRMRWPDRRPEARRQLGILLYRAGRDAEAAELLAVAAREDPDPELAYYYHGLALWRLGRRAEARVPLARAASLEPALAAESLVLRATHDLDRGDRDSARRLLERAARLEPTHPALADLAPLLAERRPGPPPRPSAPFSLNAYGGLEFDSNVTLDAGLDLGLPSDEEDLRTVFGGGFDWRPWTGGRFGLTLGYRFDRASLRDLESYDTQSHLAYASALLRTSERTALRVDGRFSSLDLARRHYVREESLRPNLFLALGQGRGLLRGHLGFQRLRYHDRPLLPSLERDGHVVGGGLEHILPLDFALFRPGSRHSLELGFDRTTTNAERDVFGLDGAYDHDRWRARWSLRLPLPWKLEATSKLSASRERYAHRNVLDFLTDDGVGTLTPRERRDTVLEAQLGLSRPIGRRLHMELSWRGTDRISNVDLYDYDRHIVGLYLRANTR